MSKLGFLEANYKDTVKEIVEGGSLVRCKIVSEVEGMSALIVKLWNKFGRDEFNLYLISSNHIITNINEICYLKWLVDNKIVIDDKGRYTLSEDAIEIAGWCEKYYQ